MMCFQSFLLRCLFAWRRLSRALTRLGFGLCLFVPASSVLATDILVLRSHDSQPYQQALQGFKNALAQHGMTADFDVQSVNESVTGTVLAEHLKQRPPQLLFTLGTPATRTALATQQTIPIVCGLLLDNEELLAHPHIASVGLDFPPNLHWQWLRRLLPDAQRIAVIFDPRHGTSLFQALQHQARAENIELIAIPALAPEDLPDLLQKLPTQLDALWAIDGVAAFNAIAVRELLLYSFRNRTPLIGLSAQWVKAGALYALDWDYADLGAQAAELAWSILAHGTSPASLPPQKPRKVMPVFNGKTAEHMKLQIPERWLPEITEVMQ